MAALLFPAAFAGPVGAAGTPCAPPAGIGDGWPTAAPQAAGFDADALCAVLEKVAGSDANIHGLVVERGGALVAELYRRGKDRSFWSVFARDTDFGPTSLHDLRSVTKSIVGLLFGIARQQRAINLAASPLTFYPGYAYLHSTERDAITLEHLLTMSSGLEWHETVTSYGTLANDETRLLWDWAPPRYVLSRSIVARPGTQFNYTGGSTAVLGDVIVRATQTPLRDFARTTLFEPLGIRESRWASDLYGRPLAFAGLRLRPRDVAKIGRLVLADGRWQGKQIVPADWVRESMRPHIAAEDGLHYGYQWWIGSVEWKGQPLPWGAGVGNGGQRLFVVPALDLTVVITAGAYNDPQIRHTVTDIFRRIVAAVRE
jgi:CubicO group peptidase (beta-lactamase class C family)